MTLTPKNWHQFQHYKKRAPIWIKLHRSLLNDFEFHKLPLASRALAPMLWLLASEYQGGRITADDETIAFRMRMSVSEFDDAVKPLIKSGFFSSSSNRLATRKRDACLEKRRDREETEREKDPIQEEGISNRGRGPVRLIDGSAA